MTHTDREGEAIIAGHALRYMLGCVVGLLLGTGLMMWGSEADLDRAQAALKGDAVYQQWCTVGDVETTEGKDGSRARSSVWCESKRVLFQAPVRLPVGSEVVLTLSSVRP